MSADLDDLEKMRADLERTLEETRAGWRNNGADGKVAKAAAKAPKLPQVRRANGHRVAQVTEDGGDRDIEVGLPRSKLFRTVKKHPVATAAAIAAVWYVIGPARVGAMTARAARTLMHNRRLMPPLVRGLSLIRSGR